VISSRKISLIRLGENSTSGEYFFQGGLPYRIDENGLQIGEMLHDQEGLLGGRPTKQSSGAERAGDENF
jgi:hypothetical protein